MFDNTQSFENLIGGEYIPPTHIGIGFSRREIIDESKLDLSKTEDLKKYTDNKIYKMENEINELKQQVLDLTSNLNNKIAENEELKRENSHLRSENIFLR